MRYLSMKPISMLNVNPNTSAEKDLFFPLFYSDFHSLFYYERTLSGFITFLYN